MYLKFKNKKIKIIKLDKFLNKLRGLKFELEPIDYGVWFFKKKFITTVFLCQRVDIIMADKNNKILYIYENVKSEKYFLPKIGVYNIYFLPVGIAKNFKISEHINIKE